MVRKPELPHLVLVWVPLLTGKLGRGVTVVAGTAAADEVASPPEPPAPAVTVTVVGSAVTVTVTCGAQPPAVPAAPPLPPLPLPLPVSLPPVVAGRAPLLDVAAALVTTVTYCVLVDVDRIVVVGPEPAPEVAAPAAPEVAVTV